MSWISRLLTHSPSLQHRASKSRLGRDKNYRRTMMSLESLEDRLVLANVSAVYNPLTMALVITGDAGNDTIRIVENSAAAGGAVTITGVTSLVAPVGVTTVNTLSLPAYTTPGPVTSITANFTLGGVNQFDKIFLTGPGKSVATTVRDVSITVGLANLGLSVNNVDNNGAFTLFTNGNINGPGTTPAQMNSPTFVSGFATIDNSTFNSLSITQVSANCVALVELGSDTISGNVNVSLGDAPGDMIQLGVAILPATPPVLPIVSDNFGPTTLSTGNGAGDVINVGQASAPRIMLRSLSITEGNGNNDRINVQFVTLRGPNTIGIVTVQGNGNTDSTIINNVTVPAGAPPFNFPTDGLLAGISVTQGNGNNDTATVSNVTGLPGNVSITQGNGGNNVNNGPGDTATVSNVTLIAVTPNSANNISITQGNGNAASASILNSIAPGNISISQGNGGPAGPAFNGAGDTALISGSTAAGVLHFDIDGNPTFVTNGNVTITQGNGNNDTATITSTRAGGIMRITQGNGNGDTANVNGSNGGFAQFINGFPSEFGGDLFVTQGNGAGDIVNLNSTGVAPNVVNNVFNNVTIVQGTPPAGGTGQGSAFLSDEVHVNDTNITSNLTITQGSIAAVGNYLITIGDTSPVTVGGITTITQFGANNVIVLGGAGTATDFITSYLDIFMGAGGGAFILASNTTVQFGSFIQPFVINAGGTGNTFYNLGANNVGLNSGLNFNTAP